MPAGGRPASLRESGIGRSLYGYLSRFGFPPSGLADAGLDLPTGVLPCFGASCFDDSSSFNATELMQYRSPVGWGPSPKTCPRWASQREHVTSTRGVPSV